MRVGIITQPLYANYGGILQNYALQQVLIRMGHTPVTLDYMPSLSFGRYIMYWGKSVLYALSPTKRHPIKPYSHFLQRPANIDSFVRSNIHLTQTLPKYSKKILKKNGIEAIIVGSDQVWRYAYNSHYILDMYLAFAKDYPCIKIAYGASFGTDKWDYPEETTNSARELAQQFNAVSVRESSGVALCKEHLNVEAKGVLDPTLLLTAADYEGFCSVPEGEETPYLAAYVLDKSEEKTAFIQAEAKSRNLKVKVLTVSEKAASVEDWLTTIRNATFVITDSYHGSLFSIIFQKPFQTIINRERGADRFLTLFEKLGLPDCLLDTIPTEPRLNKSIDYSSVQTTLQLLQKKSITFIYNSLN